MLFLDIERPLRFPVDVFNRLVVRAIARSSVIKVARRQHIEREAEFTKRWDATIDRRGADER